MSRETVRMARLGIRPPVAEVAAEEAEPEALREKLIALRGDLAMARAQRDATQRALDKANRDNDALRAALRKEKARADDLDELYRAADRAIKRFISEKEARALVDGAAIYEVEDEAK